MKKLILFLLLLLFFLLITSTKLIAQSVWFWQNPLPQGNHLYDISFSDMNHGFAVGASGTIIRTTNSGLTWTIQNSGFEGDFNSVCTIDSLTTMIFGSNAKILKTTNGGETWVNQNCGFNGPCVHASFCDINNGMVATGFVKILHTTNGGNTWTILDAPKGFMSIYMVNANTATAVVGDNGAIYKTTDAGASWIDQSYSTLDDIVDVCFSDINNGTAVGWNGIILHTTDGGTNWIWQSSNTSADLYKVSFSDANTGTAVGDNIILHTNDAGANWTIQMSPLQGITQLNGICVIDFYNELAAGQNGVIIKSTDGGLTWIEITKGIETGYNRFKAVDFIDDNIGTIVGMNGVIKHTTNAGINWVDKASQVTDELLDIKYISSIIGIAAGDNGKILRTSDTGITWDTIPSGTTNPLYSIFFLNESAGFISGLGILLKTSNAGLSWNSIGTIPSYPFNDIYFTDQLTGYSATWSYEKVLKTTDGGLTWFVQNNGTTGFDNFLSIDFIDKNTGIIAGENGKIYRTSDGGTNWTLIPSPSSYNYYKVKFINSTTGFAVGEYGKIIYTTTGGLSWENGLSITNNSLYGLCFTNTKHGTVIGEGSSILRTNSGVIVSVKERTKAIIPRDFTLYQNYPNPFNPSTTISYAISRKELVELTLFNILGQKVETIVYEEKIPGYYKVNFSVSNLNSGVYYYQLKAGSFIETMKMLLLK